MRDIRNLSVYGEIRLQVSLRQVGRTAVDDEFPGFLVGGDAVDREAVT